MCIWRGEKEVALTPIRLPEVLRFAEIVRLVNPRNWGRDCSVNEKRGPHDAKCRPRSSIPHITYRGFQNQHRHESSSEIGVLLLFLFRASLFARLFFCG